MRYFALGLFVFLFMAETASAAIVFSLTQDSPGPITLGNTAVFNVNVASDAGTINNLAGIDFVIEANDPGFTGTVATGGRFTAGTNDMFAPNGGFALPFPSSFQVFGANAGAGLTLTGTPTKVATLTLNTAGATAGSYSMNLSSLLAVDPLFNSLPIVAASPLNYTIQGSGVPEPSSLLLLAGAGLGGRRLWRRKATAR